MSATDQPSEEELRAAYEAEIKRIRVEQILLEQIVSLVNLGMRRTGLSPGTEDERDIGQVRTAIEAVRALMPIIEQSAPAQASAIRDALSQLQLAYVRLGGSEAGAEQAAGSGGAGDPGASGAPPSPGAAGPSGGTGAPGGPEAPRPGGPGAQPGEPGPAQRSGRLWVPGQ